MKLILLRCPVCNEPLTPDNDDVVLSCNNCRSLIAIAKNGVVKMKVQFALPRGGDSSHEDWSPFWVFHGSVSITKRDTQGGSRSARKESEFLWGAERRLFVPAWDLSLHTAQELGSRLTEKQPAFDLIDRPQEAHMRAATVTPGDAKKLLEFIIIAIEARRKDWLKDLAFELQVGQPALWAVPYKSLD